MKKLILLFLLLLPAVFFSFGSSCDSKGGATARGSFTYDGNTYPVHAAVVDYYGATNGSYNNDFEAASAGIDLIEYTGRGNGFYFELFTTNPTFDSGTYNYNSISLDPFTFDYAEIYIDWDIDGDSGTFVPANGGSANITVNGNEYTFEFTLSLVDGKTATGSYTGPAPRYTQ